MSATCKSFRSIDCAFILNVILVHVKSIQYIGSGLRNNFAHSGTSHRHLFSVNRIPSISIKAKNNVGIELIPSFIKVHHGTKLIFLITWFSIS